MANNATVDRAIGWVGVAIGAFGPDIAVSANIYWEEQGVVFRELTAATGRVTGEAGRAFVTVRGHAAVDAIGFGLFVAGEATEDAPIGRVGVTIGTFGPDSVVSTGIYREISSIVLGKFDSLAGRVTGKAGFADSGVAVYALVNIINGSQFMTGQAVKLGAIGWVVMTGRA